MSDRRRWLDRLAPAGLLALLALAWLLPAPDWLRLASGDARAADEMQAALDRLPERPRVLVGFDPDTGTYAEIRPTVRVLLDELAQRGTRLSVVSLTAEGRALAAAEADRLHDGQSLDLGFVAGAEAGLVDLAEELGDEVDAIVVVGGNDLGPRSWLEQVRPRAVGVPVVAITPAVLLPEVQPYLASGQLAAALATPWDGAAFRAARAEATGPAGADEPRPLAVLAGLLVAGALLAHGVGRRALVALRGLRAREAA